MKSTKYFKQDSFIALAGDTVDCIYVVNSGVVGIVNQVEGKDIVLSEVTKGELIGAHHLFANTASRKFSLKAVTDLSLTVVPLSVMESQVSELPGWAQALLKSTISNLQRTLEFVEKSGKN